MRHLILLSLLLLQSECEPPAAERTSGYTIRACSQSNISDLIDYSNQWLAATDVRFVQARDACDVEVVIGLKRPGVAADALPLTGRIRLGSHSDYRVSFMHEMLHLGGLGHEPHDRTSVMFTHAAADPAETRQLHPHHVEALRRLAGITPLGRVGAQIGAMR